MTGIFRTPYLPKAVSLVIILSNTRIKTFMNVKPYAQEMSTAWRLNMGLRMEEAVNTNHGIAYSIVTNREKIAMDHITT